MSADDSVATYDGEDVLLVQDFDPEEGFSETEVDFGFTVNDDPRYAILKSLAPREVNEVLALYPVGAEVLLWRKGRGSRPFVVTVVRRSIASHADSKGASLGIRIILDPVG